MTLTQTIKKNSILDLLVFGVRWSGRLLTNRLRGLPDFIILGTQRGGTTSLYNYLADHPQIRPCFLKETHFFDRYYKRGIGWYRAYFPFRRTLMTTASDWGVSHLTGEATPYYLYHPHVPNRVHKAIPQAKLIVLLRNPVDRAYSHYNHVAKNGLESLTFEKAIERELEIMPVETQKILDDENYLSFTYQNYSYLSRGIYIDQLLNWFKYFNRDRILVLKSETFYDDPSSALNKTLEFLGLPIWAPISFEKYNLAHYTPMKDTTHKWLTEYFRPHNSRLYEYLGEDFYW
jgi:hypothetical protein